jgi:hypothetical protein
MIYYALSNMDVAISKDKKKVRRYAKRSLRFSGVDLQMGAVPIQVFNNPERFQKEFGICLIHDVDQDVIFRPDFSLVRSSLG